MSKGILVLTRTLGDIVIGNVLVKNIKKKFTDMELDYVVEEGYESLIKDNPNVYSVIKITSTGSEFDKILKLLPNYDEVFMAQQTTPIDNSWHQNEPYNKGHLLDFYANRCNIEIADRKLELYCNSEINVELREQFQNAIVIHTTTLADVKNWSHFNELVAKLLLEGHKVIQLSGPNDVKIPGAIYMQISLQSVLEVFKSNVIKVFIGLDSGLSYIAASYSTPSIILMGATIPTTSGIYGDNIRILFADNPAICKEKRNGIRCHGIHKGKCAFGAKCIDTISADTVIEQVHETLKEEQKNG